VQSRRDELRKDNQPIANEWLDCTKCQELNNQVKRRMWRCGHLAERLWLDPGFAPPPSWPARIGTVCPGYLVSLPAVEEVSYAYQWFDAGQLSQWLDGAPIPAALKQCLSVLKSAIAGVESAMLNDAKG